MILSILQLQANSALPDMFETYMARDSSSKMFVL
jgi:hypothetical protein